MAMLHFITLSTLIGSAENRALFLMSPTLPSPTKRNEEIAAFFEANRQRVFEELSVIILSHAKNED